MLSEIVWFSTYDLRIGVCKYCSVFYSYNVGLRHRQSYDNSSAQCPRSNPKNIMTNIMTNSDW